MNEEQQRTQRRLKILVISIVGVIFFLCSAYVLSDYFVPVVKKNRKYSTHTTLPMDGVNPGEIWVDQIRTDNEIVHNKVDFIQDLLVQQKKDEGERETSKQNEILLLRNELENLKSELKKTQTQQVSEKLKAEVHSVTVNEHQDGYGIYENASFYSNVQETFGPLSSVSCPEAKNLRHINRTIPAGTSVKAILVSSVDMPCGVKGGTDPLPVKLRIIADGRLPHEVRARLKSGIVTASVYGDLSSERVYFRLEKLTQVRPDGHYIETQVAGYVSGEDGKYGVRGTVVDKSSILIENAMISGFLSGASDFFETAALASLYPATLVEAPYGPGRAHSPSWGQTAGQLGVAGGSAGITNALDALTDYFIKRAEQLRPVIQITPGRIVDITFSDSADLGDLYTHEKVRKSGKQGVSCEP